MNVKQKKILIADDEHKIVMALEYSFRKQGYQVFIARDGTEVLELLKEQSPDVLLLDVMMPKLDGFSTLEIIRKNEAHKAMKVVFLSAKIGEKNQNKALALGADDYFTKPYSVKKLLERIEELLLISH